MPAVPGHALRVAVVGGGWAGLAAAVLATQAGHSVTLFEAARTLGGRARSVDIAGEDGQPLAVDNGQHILIGAYTETLALMNTVGVDTGTALLRLPLDLRFADGGGLVLPRWPAPLDALAGIVGARGWSLRDRLALIATAARWQRQGFECGDTVSVAALCRNLPLRVRNELVDPLCVSALNTPAAQASGQVFLRVLRDAMFGVSGGSHLLLPRLNLGALLPDAAATWLRAQGAQVRAGHRVQVLRPSAGEWEVDGERFGHVLLACAPWDAARLATAAGIGEWAATADSLRFESIATVYAMADAALPRPMVALRPGPGAPAQFVFDRAQLALSGRPEGLIAFVVSASHGDRDAVQTQTLKQGRAQLRDLGIHELRPLQTVVEKRATFACTPGLVRPAQQMAPGLQACGDYVDGPYPATLEGAVRSAKAAVASIPIGVSGQ